MHDNLVYATEAALGNRSPGAKAGQTLSDVAASMQSVYSRATGLKERTSHIKEFLLGSAPSANGRDHPREVPSGIIGDMAATREALSDCFDVIESDLSRIAVSLGIDKPPSTR